jgi:hypothetical protein
VNHIEILRFIELIKECFPNAEQICTQGSCIRFALLLQHQYPKGKILYNIDHAIFEYEGQYFDIGGIAIKTTHIPIEEYGILALDKLLKLRYGTV